MDPRRELRRASAPFSAAYRTALRVLVGVLVVYVALVATHRGEFWPFSIYPMFSLAGRPWTRAMVREVSLDHVMVWDTAGMDELPGEPFGLTPRSIGNNDVANFVAKTQHWDEERIKGLRRLFASQLQGRALVFYAARGELVSDPDADDKVHVRFVPVLILRPQGHELRPDLANGGAAI